MSADRFQLRPGIRVVRSGPTTVLLVDDQAGGCYSIGPGEARLIELLTEHDTVDEVRTAFAAATDGALSEKSLREFVLNLRQLGLLDAPGPTLGEVRVSARPVHAIETAIDPRRVTRLNAIFDLLVLFFGWVLHSAWLAPLGLLVFCAANILLRHTGEVVSSLERAYHLYPVWVGLILLVLPKLLLISFLSALLVGMVARKYGASVRGFHVRWFKNLVPYFAVEMGDSVALLADRGRHTAISLGFLFSLALAALSLVGWRMAPPGSSADTLWISTFTTCVVRLAIHANPFFQFASAHLTLCNLFGEWDLMPWAIDETEAWLKGGDSPRPLSDRERVWLRCFGLGYWCYRALVSGALVVAAFLWILPNFHAAGALAVLALLVWWNYDLIERQPEVYETVVA